MTRNPRLTAFRLVAGALLPAILSVSTLQAAETARWAELPSRICKLQTDCPEDREYSITTKDGQTFRGQELGFDRTGGVRVKRVGPSIPGAQVAEVRTRHRMPWIAALLLPAGKALGALVDNQCRGGGYCFPVMTPEVAIV